MNPLTVSTAEPGALAELAALAAEAQADPQRFVVYLGDDAADIAGDIAAIAGWPAVTRVATRAGRIVGWLLAETDPELHRVWWWGPVVAGGEPWEDVADALYAAARGALGADIGEEELAADVRSSLFDAFAGRHGFHAETGATILHIDIGATAADHRVAALTPAHADAVAALHDELFPHRHLTGRQLVTAEGGIRLVACDGEAVIGYVAVELQAGGAGYIDFLGVEPRRRGQGVGQALVATALDALRRQGVTAADLTVRSDLDGARRLYRRLGFEAQRDVLPYRKGFSLEA